MKDIHSVNTKNNSCFQSIEDITGPIDSDAHSLESFIYPSARKHLKTKDLTVEELDYIERFLSGCL